jgi:hypothetical protein
MPVRVSPDQAANKWRDRLSGASAEITAGIERVNQAPTQRAVAKREKWRQNLAASEEKWVRNTGRVSLEDWKRAALDFGVPRIAQGAAAKVGKMENFMSDFLPFLARGVQQVEGMPDLTFENRIQRAVAMMRHNHGFKRS